MTDSERVPGPASAGAQGERHQARVDEHGRAFKGSQLQVQIYANRRQDELEHAVRQALSTLDEAAEAIEWVSPLESKRFAEYKDVAFLQALGLDRLAPELARYWPTGGPVWDGLARVRLKGGGEGVLLAEGKSYPDELYGAGSGATAETSKQLIKASLEQTQAWLGLPAGGERWLGTLYQPANRLAHLYFLRELAGVQAWLVHLCFVDDVDHIATNEAEWGRALEDLERELGLVEALPYAGAALLPARPRSDLVERG